mgnify:CR=1 FL=1
MEELVYKIKESMRFSHNLLDQEILENIESCMLDMERVGIQPFLVENEEIDRCKLKDKLVEKAAELYCKWQEDFQGKAERYEKAYNSLRDSLSLCDEYRRNT